MLDSPSTLAQVRHGPIPPDWQVFYGRSVTRLAGWLIALIFPFPLVIAFVVETLAGGSFGGPAVGFSVIVIYIATIAVVAARLAFLRRQAMQRVPDRNSPLLVIRPDGFVEYVGANRPTIAVAFADLASVALRMTLSTALELHHHDGSMTERQPRAYFGRPGDIAQAIIAARIKCEAAGKSLRQGVENGPQMGRIFISYRRDDTEYISGYIHDYLARAFGKDRIFFDVDTIAGGVDYRKAISDSIADTAIMLVVIGPKWLTAEDPLGARRLAQLNDPVRLEIEAALQRNTPVFPLLVQQASVPAESALPSSIAQLSFQNAFAVRPGADFPRDMERVCATIERYLPRRPSLS